MEKTAYKKISCQFLSKVKLAADTKNICTVR
jgi:hypothetical protein